MAGATGLQVYIGATTEDLAKGLADAKRQIDGWARDAVAKSQATGSGARAAGKEFEGLGASLKKFATEQRAEARTASFFVGELAQIVPVGNAAKGVLTQLGGALVGGGIVGIGIAAATTAVGLLTAAWQEHTERVKEAKRALEEIAAGWDRFRLAQVGASGATKLLFEQTAAIEKDKEVLRLKEEIAAAQTEVNLLVARQAEGEASTGQVEDARRALADLEEQIRRRRGELLSAIEAGARPALAAEQSDALGKRVEAGEKASEAAAKEAAALQRATDARREYLTVEERIAAIRAGNGIVGWEDAAKAKRDSRAWMPDAGALSWTGFTGDDQPNELIKQLTKDQEAYNEQVRASSALAQEWGARLGAVFADLATGQMTARQAIAQVGKAIVDMVVKNAITQITTNAYVSGSEAAKSQAGIPVVGPALAISAMGAMISSVLALLGNVKARARGGAFAAGDTLLVGEEGPEVVRFSRSGGVIPNDKLRAASGASAGGRPVYIGAVYAMDAKSFGDFLEDGALDELERKRARRARDGR